MASLRHETDRGRSGLRLQFRLKNRRASIWLGQIPEWKGQEIKVHVEHLVAAAKANRPPELSTSEWLGSVDDVLRNKLARYGLCEPVETRTVQCLSLKDWIDTYIRERKDVKPSTLSSYDRARQNLNAYFGANKLLKDVSVEDAKQWRVWLRTQSNRRDAKRQGISDETVRRRTGLAKQFFREAVERGYINENPFAKLTSATQGNPRRQFFVEASVIERCINHSTCRDWRTILALARYGGLRTPSEIVPLRWSDIDFDARAMVVNASKTEHHATGGRRVCPIFPELLKHLENARRWSPKDREFVITRYRRPDQNLHEAFKKILRRANIDPWPRLFQNLRASRETELLASYPVKDVTDWLGNSAAVAMRNYAMATSDQFRKAAGFAETTNQQGPLGGVIGGAIQGHSEAIYDSMTEAELIDLARKKGLLIVEDSDGQNWIMGVEGLEPPTPSV